MRIHKSRYMNLRLSYPGASRRPDDQRKKVGIFGPWNMPLENWLWFCKHMDRLVFALDDPIICCRGSTLERTNNTDKLSMNWATHNWYTALVFYPDESRLKLPDALRKRDEEFLTAADFVVGFNDGQDKEVARLITSCLLKNVKAKFIEV